MTSLLTFLVIISPNDIRFIISKRESIQTHSYAMLCMFNLIEEFGACIQGSSICDDIVDHINFGFDNILSYKFCQLGQWRDQAKVVHS